MNFNVVKNNCKKFTQSKFSLIVMLVVSFFLITGNAQAKAFEKGSSFVLFNISSAQFINSNYTLYGIGVGYYVIDGLELALEYTTWQGGNRKINEYSPSARYVFKTGSRVNPYLGAFYRKTDIENLENLGAYGARYGIYIEAGKTFIGLGGVYTSYQNCTETLYTSCSSNTTEVSVGVAF